MTLICIYTVALEALLRAGIEVEPAFMHDLRELAAFVAVVSSGNLTASARALDLPKSTLSRRIRQLEARVGHPLMRRESNSLIPTEAGQLFARYCQQILGLAEQGQEALDELREEVSGDLVINVHNAFVRGWIGEQVEAFMQCHPRVSVTLGVQVGPPTPVNYDKVWLWLGKAPDCGLRHEAVGHLSHGLYASPEYLQRYGVPEHPRDLERRTWVDLLGQRERGLALHHPTEGRFLLGPSPTALKVDQLVLQGDAIVRGQGIGLLPHWLAELRSRAHPGTLQLCLPEWQGPAQPVWLLYPYGHLPRRMRAFLQHIRNGVPACWREVQTIG